MAASSVDKIRVGDRFRKDLGDIESLARSIFEIGLLHPIVITPDKKLIAGRRRLEAFRRLNRKEIPVHVVDIESMARGEHDENTVRKSFTSSESVAIGQAVREEKKDQAKKRRRRHGETAPGHKKITSGKIPQVLGEPGKTRDQVAAVAGMSERTFARAEAVVKAAEEDPETFGPIKDEMDSSGNVSAAHKKVQTAKGVSEEKKTSKAVSALTHCKSNWSRVCDVHWKQMTAKERQEFVAWIKEE